MRGFSERQGSEARPESRTLSIAEMVKDLA
jgi:hypothetical protein